MKHCTRCAWLTRVRFIAVYAFGETFVILFVARAVQGIGSSLISVSGICVLSHSNDDTKNDDKNNGNDND